MEDQKQVKWLGSKIEKCDLCGLNIESVGQGFVDGRTQNGHWAIMCLRCYVLNGVGTGIGKGQLYAKVSGQNDWIKIKG